MQFIAEFRIPKGHPVMHALRAGLQPSCRIMYRKSQRNLLYHEKRFFRLLGTGFTPFLCQKNLFYFLYVYPHCTLPFVSSQSPAYGFYSPIIPITAPLDTPYRAGGKAFHPPLFPENARSAHRSSYHFHHHYTWILLPVIRNRRSPEQ